MFKLFKRMRSLEWSMVAGMAVFILGQVWLELKLPDYMREITQLVQTEGSAMRDIFAAGGMMLLCAFGSMAMAIITSYLAARLAAAFSHRLRHDVFHRVEDFSLEELGHFSTASLITRSTNDVMQVQMLLAMGLQVVMRCPFTLVVAISKISGKSWQWSLTTAIASAILILTVTIVLTLCVPKFKLIQTLTDNLNRVTRENLTGLRVVRAYNAEGYQERKFEQANEELMSTNLFTSRTTAILNPVITSMMTGLSLAVYWVGAFLIEAAGLDQKVGLFSDMVVFSNYAMQIVMTFMMMSMMFTILPRVMVSARRINEVLEVKPHIQDGGKTIAAGAPHGKVEFDHVYFRYPGGGDWVLEDLTFTAEPGQTVAVIGATGSGKTTLVNLITRFYDVSQGSVRFDGVDVRELKQHDLRNRIGYVSQKAQLFYGTVRSNVAFGEGSGAPADDAAVREAVDIAQATEFVEQMPETYDAHIAQNGANVSGGQKQRLSIARAVARKPELYIFDDSFSALDYKTDRVLRTQLKQRTAGVTSIIVAQRIGTIRDADQILVLDEGKIVGCGKHDELMKTCKVYQEIAYSQLSREELEA